MSFTKCRLGLDGAWKTVSSDFCEWLNYTGKELKQISFADIVHPEHAETASEFIRKLVEKEKQEFEARLNFLGKNKEPVLMQVSGMLVRDEEGRADHIFCHIHNLSQQEELRRKLQESKQQFESLFEHNPLPVYYFDLEGNFVEVNDKLAEFTGYAKEELLKMNFERFIVKEDLERTKEQFVKAASGKPGQYEIQVIVKGDVKRDIRVTKFPMYMGDEITGVYGILQDITEQKKAEKNLVESEQLFKSLFAHNPYPVMRFDLDGKFKDANDRAVEMSGFPKEEFIGMDFSSFIAEEDMERVAGHFQKALQGEPQHYEVKGHTNNGIIEVEAVLSPIYVNDEITGLFTIAKDITEEKRAKRALEKSGQRFKSLFERNPNAVYSFDTEGNFMQANKALEDLVGYTIDELKQLNFEPLTAPEDREKVWGKFEKAARGEPQTYEAAGVHKNGSKVYVQITNLPIYVDGEIVGVFGIANDITENKKAQRKIRESEKRWQQLVEQNPQPVQITRDGKIVFINQVGAEYFGASSPEELIGKNALDFAHPDSVENALKRKKKLENNEPVKPDEHKIMLLNGEERYVESHSIPITYKGSHAVQTVIHDITDMKEKQQIVGRSLREKETLLQEIHHRVKNNLAVISGLLELQVMQSTEQPAINALRDSQLRIQSMAMIHEKLYQTESLHNIGFDEYLEELVQTVNSTYDVSGDAFEITFDMDQVFLGIDQAIPCSLVVNEVAVNCYKHAFSENGKGKIHISLDYSRPDIHLRISDDGCGLPEDFDIDGQQSLGMKLIKTLCLQLDGSVSFENNPEGPGTVFKLSFKKNPGDH